jgi:hypothetical protein
MAHTQKQDFVFRRNGRVHLNRRKSQFSRLLAAEVCASAVVKLHTPCSEVVGRVLAIHSIRQFPLHFPSRASPCAITFQLDSNSLWNGPSTRFCHILGSKTGSFNMAPGTKITTVIKAWYTLEPAAWWQPKANLHFPFVLSCHIKSCLNLVTPPSRTLIKLSNTNQSPEMGKCLPPFSLESSLLLASIQK